MNTKISTLTVMALATGSMAFANTILIEQPTFGTYEGWIFGANRFQPATNWLEFVQAPKAFTYESRVVSTGSGFTLTSWDDEIADRIELYIYNEHMAAPPAGDVNFLREIFTPGDVIKFKGSARATKSGADTSDVIVRAFIKTLGYGRYAFDTLTDYTRFFPLTSELQAFDLTLVYPEDTAAEPFQVIQVGFEISTEYDGTAMDSATIYFENIEAYIEGGATPTWNGYDIDAGGFADTGAWMGMVNVTSDPWIYVYDLGAYVYIPAEGASTSGAWTFVPGQ